YEQAFAVIRRLALPMQAREQQFRRMLFNVVGRNQDDHVKNIAFLMDERGNWSLSPAYDLTYGYDPANLWLSQHQMSVNGKFDGFTREDLMKLADTVSLSRSTAADLIGEVGRAVGRWEEFAAVAGAPEDYAQQIKANQRLHLAR
ncbi:MAG TPA: HipA domain-containing protein, partial [Steroidobacteraceae bacterium]|nr:HipA domain-containing protein [Steroidobacteraceae bacterium]